MNSARVCAVLLLATSCSHSKLVLHSDSDRGAPLCRFEKIPWRTHTALLVRGGIQKLGYVDAIEVNSRPVAPLAHGVVRSSGEGVVYESRFEALGTVIEGDVDLSADSPLHSIRRLKLGELGVLLEGSTLEVRGGQNGFLEVEPSSAATADFHPDVPVRVTIGCGDASLGQEPVPATDAQKAAALQPLGFGEVLLERDLDGSRPVPVLASPSGTQVGHFLASGASRRVKVSETKDEFSRILYEGEPGVFWFGWVRTADFVPEGMLGTIGTGRIGTRERSTPRVCAEKLDLSERVAGEVLKIGTLGPQATFRPIGKPANGLVPIELGHEWFRAVDGAQLLLPESAHECPQVQ